jgi:hypothetical protein
MKSAVTPSPTMQAASGAGHRHTVSGSYHEPQEQASLRRKYKFRPEVTLIDLFSAESGGDAVRIAGVVTTGITVVMNIAKRIGVMSIRRTEPRVVGTTLTRLDL